MLILLVISQIFYEIDDPFHAICLNERKVGLWLYMRLTERSLDIAQINSCIIQRIILGQSQNLWDSNSLDE